MHAGLLAKIFAPGAWHGPCTVLLDADASVSTTGPDSVVSGGVKMYAPRIITGRVSADAACFLPDQSCLVMVQQTRSRQQTGEEVVRHTVMVVDSNHIAGVEFVELDVLETLGLKDPGIQARNEYRPGALVG
jgi:hypothetical protein